jgi:hypothetical protein
VDSAAALTPIIDGVKESSEYSVRDEQDVKCGWQWRVGTNEWNDFEPVAKQSRTGLMTLEEAVSLAHENYRQDYGYGVWPIATAMRRNGNAH